MKRIGLLLLLVMFGGCSQYSNQDLVNADGTPSGLRWHGLRQTGDLASWQHTSVITFGDRVIAFATDRGAGLIDALVRTSGTVGAGYFIGSGLKNANGDVTEIDNINGQFQEQTLKGGLNRGN